MAIRVGQSVTAASLLFAGLTSASALGAPQTHPAPRSVRAAVVAVFSVSDGSASEVRGVYVPAANTRLAVVCVRTPDAGSQAFVYRRVGRSWRYVVSGVPGRSGTYADRQLERACR